MKELCNISLQRNESFCTEVRVMFQGLPGDEGPQGPPGSPGCNGTKVRNAIIILQ